MPLWYWRTVGRELALLWRTRRGRRASWLAIAGGLVLAVTRLILFHVEHVKGEFRLLWYDEVISADRFWRGLLGGGSDRKDDATLEFDFANPLHGDACVIEVVVCRFKLAYQVLASPLVAGLYVVP